MFDINKIDEIIDGYADNVLHELNAYVNAYVAPESIKALAELISARSKYGENGADNVVYTLSNKADDSRGKE